MFTPILVPLDGSVLAECVLPHVLTFVQAFGANTTLVRAIAREEPEEHARPVDAVEWQIKRAEADAYLERVSERLGSLGVLVDCDLLEGDPSRFGASTYHIVVKNPDGVTGGVAQVALDDTASDSGGVSLREDGGMHEVLVTLGAPKK